MLLRQKILWYCFFTWSLIGLKCKATCCVLSLKAFFKLFFVTWLFSPQLWKECVCFKWHCRGQARLTTPVLCVSLSRVTLRVCTLGVWEKERQSHQKAYSAAFPLLKSVSEMCKGKWLTQSVSWQRSMTDWFSTGVFELIFLFCCLSPGFIIIVFFFIVPVI